MKKILLLMLVCFSAVLAMAQKPMNTHYVYEVRNNQGTLIQNRAVTCTLKVVKNTNDTIFKETHSATTDNLGRITVTLGKGTSLVETAYNNVSWSKTDNYILYATVKTDTLILGSEVPLLVGGNADSTTVVNLFGTKLPLARVATSGSYSDLTNRPTSINQFDNDAHFLTSDSAVIQTMKSNIQTNQSNIATNAANIELLKNTNFDTIYNLGEQDAKLHLTKDYGFKIFNWAKLPNNEAAVYIINQSADTVTKTSALTAKDHDTNPSMTAFLAGKDPELGQAAVIGTVNQGGNPVVTGALGYSKDGLAAAVMANGPIAFGNGHYATDINNTNALSASPSPYTLVTEATLSGSIAGLQTDSHTHSNKAVLDRTDRAYTQTDSTKLAGIAAGAQVNVQADWNATEGDAFINNKPTIPAAANDATITISKNGESVGSFSVNASEDKSINITVPTTVAELSDANNYVTTNTEQTISGNKSFSDMVIVPSGFNFTTTTSESCNMAVNACDLLTVFDSIQRQFTALRAEIDGLRDSLNNLRGASEPNFTQMDFERAENSLTATATFDDGGATITEYNFCISTSQEMTASDCHTTEDASYTFSGLNAGTQYYVTVAATNLKGTTTSNVHNVQTVHAKPVLGEAAATPVSNTEIKVEGELTEMGGTTPTTVTVYAYTNSDYSDAEPIHGTDSIITTAPNEFKVKVDGLTKGTTYYLAVIANNGDKQDTVKTSATTLDITVEVTSEPATDTILTGSNVDVTVRYTATVTGIDAAEDGYTWKVNDTDSTSTSNELTVHYTKASTYTVVCAYNGATDTVVTVLFVRDTITFIPNGGTGTMNKQIVKRGVDTNLTANAFSHDGWTFKGWSTDCDHIVTYEGCNTRNEVIKYDNEGVITTEGNVILYAVWATSCEGTASSNETATGGNVSSVNDVDGNDYAVVQIGSQCWMKEDLRTTKLVDGTELENGTHYELNDNGTMSYSNSILDNICPAGWHVPSKDEWNQLFDYIKNDESLRCGDDMYLKALATPCGWISTQPNTCGICDELESNNKLGFSMFPQYDPEPNYAHSLSYYWTNTKEGGDNFMLNINGTIGSGTYSPISQIAPLVRCLRNEEHRVSFNTTATSCTIEDSIVNGTIELPTIEEDCISDGFIFNGWNTKSDGSGTHFNAGYEITPTSDTTFYIELFHCGAENSRVYDSENNGYLTVEIGERCYLAENLRTQTVETGHAYPANDSEESVAEYGMLYDYETAQGICPPGWKLPTLEELSETTIDNFAIKMAGLYTSDGYSNFFGNSAYFWTSDDNSGLTDAAYYKAFFKFSSAEPNSGSMIKTNAASVRCVFSSTNE